jgi:hypothetical protein
VLLALTPTGAFHIRQLRLNRPPLVQRRLRNRLVELMHARESIRGAENARLREIIEQQRRIITRLRELLKSTQE